MQRHKSFPFTVDQKCLYWSKSSSKITYHTQDSAQYLSVTSNRPRENTHVVSNDSLNKTPILNRKKIEKCRKGVKRWDLVNSSPQPEARPPVEALSLYRLDRQGELRYGCAALCHVLHLLFFPFPATRSASRTSLPAHRLPCPHGVY